MKVRPFLGLVGHLSLDSNLPPALHLAANCRKCSRKTQCDTTKKGAKSCEVHHENSPLIVVWHEMRLPLMAENNETRIVFWDASKALKDSTTSLPASWQKGNGQATTSQHDPALENSGSQNLPFTVKSQS